MARAEYQPAGEAGATPVGAGRRTPPREPGGLAVLLVVLLSVGLHAPSLWWGSFADDHVHALVLEGRAPDHGASAGPRPWSLYDFGSVAAAPWLRDVEGFLPPWTGDDWRVRFLRPISSLARWAEHALGRGSPVVAHAAGLLWWAFLLVLAHRLYLVLGLAPRAALWALVLLALENGSVLAVGWNANRNSTVEGVLLVAAVLAYVRGLGAGARPRLRSGLLLGALALALAATLAKESGVAALALFAAWSWLGRRAAVVTPARARVFEAHRWRWAAVAVVLAAAYLALYVALGYGARSLFYPTPWGQPAAWLARASAALPAGVVAMTTPLATDAVHAAPGLLPATVALGVLLLLLLRPVVAPSVRAHGAGPFLVAWVVLTTLPQAGAPLSDRLFLVPMVGGAGLLGIFLEATRLRAAEGWARRSERLTRVGVVASGVVLSGAALLATGVATIRIAAFTRAALTEAEVGAPALGRRDVLVLQSPSQLVSLQPDAAFLQLTGDDGVRFHVLNATRRGVRWTRTGPRSFRLEATEEAFLEQVFERVFLTAEPRFEVGDAWRAGPVEVRVADVEEGLPTALEVTLDRELEDPRLRFLAWDASAASEAGHGRWVHLAPPAAPESRVLGAAPAPVPLLP